MLADLAATTIVTTPVTVSAPDLTVNDLPLGSGTGAMSSNEILDLAVLQQQLNAAIKGIAAPGGCPWYQQPSSSGVCSFPSTLAVAAGAIGVLAVVLIGGR
jgi:hypothetical protein